MSVEFTARCPPLCNGDAVWVAERVPVPAIEAAYGNSDPIMHTYRIVCDVGGGPCHVTPNS